jgi:hypothetical protein
LEYLTIDIHKTGSFGRAYSVEAIGEPVVGAIVIDDDWRKYCTLDHSRAVVFDHIRVYGFAGLGATIGSNLVKV